MYQFGLDFYAALEQMELETDQGLTVFLGLQCVLKEMKMMNFVALFVVAILIEKLVYKAGTACLGNQTALVEWNFETVFVFSVAQSEVTSLLPVLSIYWDFLIVWKFESGFAYLIGKTVHVTDTDFDGETEEIATLDIQTALDSHFLI